MEESIINGYKLRKINITDNEYPKKLKLINNAPKTIYVLGNLPDENKKSVAIVGARNCSDYGSVLSKTISKQLSDNNVQVISGLAMGIDTAGHLGALEVEKPTFAVLGCGVDICFPSHNANVYKKILENGGGIISEVDIGTPPLPQNFPLRNRIISGLSDAVIVVESRDKSGSLITADFALEQGKAVFACPGRIGDHLSEGTNNLIKNGSYIFSSSNDVFEYLNLPVINKNLVLSNNLNNLDYFEKIVYKELINESLHIDQIVDKTKLPYDKVVNILMALELEGLICSSINNYYMVKDLNMSVDDIKNSIKNSIKNEIKKDEKKTINKYDLS